MNKQNFEELEEHLIDCIYSANDSKDADTYSQMLDRVLTYELEQDKLTEVKLSRLSKSVDDRDIIEGNERDRKIELIKVGSQVLTTGATILATVGMTRAMMNFELGGHSITTKSFSWLPKLMK